jgi:hypothetical protein
MGRGGVGVSTLLTIYIYGSRVRVSHGQTSSPRVSFTLLLNEVGGYLVGILNKILKNQKKVSYKKLEMAFSKTTYKLPLIFFRISVRIHKISYDHFFCRTPNSTFLFY